MAAFCNPESINRSN